MPFFRHVEPAARSLRPLAAHPLVLSPVLAPAPDEAPSRGRRLPMVGGVAVLAVAGVLVAGLGSSSHQAAPASPAATVAAPAVAAVTPPASGLGTLLTPVAYAVPMRAAAAKTVLAKTAKAKTPSVKSAAAPRGAAVVTHGDTMNVKAMSSALHRLRTCESGGNYREASGNGYYGAYQFDLSTWRSLGLSGVPSNASHQLQDVAVTRLEARKGWGPWPVCSYVAGLR